MIYTRKNIDLNYPESESDLKAWENLYNQYLSRYGLGKMYKRLLSIMKEKADLEIKYVLTRERFKLTQIELKEAELKQIIDTNNTGLTVDQALIHLSKWIGYRLDPREITVIEYFTILNEYGKANQKN